MCGLFDNMKDNLNQLREVVEQTHKCSAIFVESVHVTESFQGKTVWDGTVFIFDINGNPLSTRCYAWSSPMKGTTKRRFFAVLHVPPIDSPQNAVRAAIVQEYKSGPND